MDHRTTNCYACQSRGQTEWCSIEGEDLQLLNRAKVSNLYQVGQPVFYQGNPCMGVYCIESGTIALRKTDAAGNSVLVRLLGAGDTMGYRAYFSGGAYTATAEPLAPTKVCFVDKVAIQRLLERNPAVGVGFLKRLSNDLLHAEDAVLHANTLSVRARLAHLLLGLKERFGAVRDDGSLVIDLPLSRQDIASMIGTRPETVARSIRALEEADVARFEGRTVVVPDLDALLDELDVA